MSKVQTLPRFKPKDLVDLYADPGMAEEEDVPETVFVTATQVKARYHVDALGWVYRLAGVNGLIEDRWLQRHVNVTTDEPMQGTIYATVTPEEARTVREALKYQTGQLVRIVGDEGVSMDDELVGLYALVVGHVYCSGELTYICALRHTRGHYIDSQDEFFEDELEALSEAELASMDRTVGRPKLTVVRTQ